MDRDQLTALKVSVDMARELNTENWVLTTCPECSTPSVVDTAHGIFVCGYCGSGPHLAYYEMPPQATLPTREQGQRKGKGT